MPLAGRKDELMFTKQDEEFAETAVDTTRRGAAITDLSNRRAKLFWGACFGSVATIASTFASEPDGALAFLAATLWILFFKFESDLRLLRVIDRLQRHDKELA